MEFDNLYERIIQLNNSADKNTVVEFLEKQGLSFDGDIEYTVGIFDGDNIIAAGSFSGRILKCIAVEKSYHGIGVSNRLVSHLVSEQYRRGMSHLFIYTKPENHRLFKDLGFYKIAEVSRRVVLLENDPCGIKKYVDEIKQKKIDGEIISSIVVNCNPFTLGHQHIIEKASSESHVVHVFVLWEDRSSFPSDVRYKLVCEGVKHLKNVFVHRGRDYIISDATFPSYFIKNIDSVVETHALLDIGIFATHIAPALGINMRYVGEEPYCMVTNTYNNIMKSKLPGYGIDVVEIPRLKFDGRAVSASKVRELIALGDIEATKSLVPETTYDYLTSKEAILVIEKISQLASRH